MRAFGPWLAGERTSSGVLDAGRNDVRELSS